MGARTGAVDETLNRPLAEKQAASIGATIGSDGWWYKDGRRLSHNEADALTRQAGTAAENLGAWGKNRDIWGRASDLVSKGWAATPLGQIKIGGDVGGFLERNKADIAAGVGTILSGGNPLVGAAIKAGLEGAKYGATGLDAAKGAFSGYGTGTLASGLQGATQAALRSTGGVMDTTKAAYGGFGAGTAAAKQKASDTLAGWFGGTSAAPVAAAPAVGTIPTPSVSTSTVPQPRMSYLDSLKTIFSPEDLSKISLKDIGAVLGGAAKGYEGYQAGQAQQAQVDIARRKQELLEKDYARQLAIAAARERELAPMRAQLMQMLMGQPSTLFGGSVLQGLTEPKRNA
ncbi:MAG: hypothetical protein EBR73_16780 [Rhodobacteraceae bacterium]|nr:hypothetical protein [Paracoccaceae bacterium]